jgi:uncharacterized protein
VSKFQPLSAYQQPLVDGYQLLPFRFTLLDDHEYVLTNQAGEFIVLERPTLEAVVRHQLPATDQLYDDLKSKHFIIDRDSSVAMDLLPLKVRTKLQRLADFTALHLFVVSGQCRRLQRQRQACLSPSTRQKTRVKGAYPLWRRRHF